MIGTRGHYGIALRELNDLPDVQLVAVAPGGPLDSIQPIFDWANKNKASPRLFENWRDVIAKDIADAVVVCGPFELHAEMTLAAIEKGLHVYAEKPCALNFDELRELRAAVAKHNNIHVAAMMQSRFDAGFYTAWSLIQAGAIGEIRLINSRKSYKRGKRADFYRDRVTYGGTIPWVGSHSIDWTIWMAGRMPESVFASHSSLSNGGVGTMESTAACMFTFSNGLAATASVDVLRPENAKSHGDDWIRLVGTKGVIEARPDSVHLVNENNDGSKAVPVSCDRRPFADFVNHILHKVPALIDARQSFDLTEALLLARQSADEARLVHFPRR